MAFGGRSRERRGTLGGVAHARLEEHDVGGPHRPGDSPGRAGLRGRRGVRKDDRDREGPTREVSRDRGALSAERRAAGGRRDLARSGSRERAPAHCSDGQGAVGILRGAGRRDDRARDEGWRRARVARRSQGVPREVADADRVRVPRPHHHRDAAAVVGGADDGDDRAPMRRVGPSRSRLALGGAGAPDLGGDAPSVRRAQPEARRPGFREEPRGRAALRHVGHGAADDGAARPGDAHRGALPERSSRRRGRTAHDPPRRRRRGRKRGLDDDDDQRVVRERSDRPGPRLRAQRRDGRLRDGTGNGEHVRSRAGRAERHRAGQANAVVDVADHRSGARGAGRARAGSRGRVAHHHGRLPGALERPRLRDGRGGRGARAAFSPAGFARRADARAARAPRRRAPGARGDGARDQGGRPPRGRARNRTRPRPLDRGGRTATRRLAGARAATRSARRRRWQRGRRSANLGGASR